MSGAFYRSDSDNVNVTLAQTGLQGSPLLGRQFPCCVCGAGMEIRFTQKKNSKPYMARPEGFEPPTLCLEA